MAEIGTAEDQAAAGGGDIAALAEEIRKNGGSPALPAGAGHQAGTPEPVQAKFPAISPKAVMSLVTLPASIAHAMTDNDLWLLDEEEKKALAEQTAEALNVFLNLDPKKFLGISLMVTVAAVYGTRTVAYFNEKKKEEKKP